MKPVGFIGLGIMGKPMAKNLLKHGKKLMVYDINQKAVEELCQAGAESGSIEQLCQACGILFTILPNGTIVEDVLFGKEGIAKFGKKGLLVCDMSSTKPTEASSFGERLAEYDISFVDAPVSGGEPKAIDGTLAIMAGGTEADFEKVKPYFLCMGEAATLVGPMGSGCVAKLTNQMIVNLTIAAVAEGFVLAEKAGADPEKVYEAIRYGFAGSTVLDAKLPMMLDRNFKPGGKISINRKDIKNVLDTAHTLDIPVPMTSQLFEVMQALKVAGQMEEDHSSMVKYFERLAGVEVKRA